MPRQHRAGLQVDHDEGFCRRDWKVQRVGWALMLLMANRGKRIWI